MSENKDIQVSEHKAPTGNSLLFSPQSMQALDNIAQVMAMGTSTVPDHFKKKPADCLAIVMQAAQWNMNPFAVAQKTHLVSGTLGYEAQLVNAVISSSTAIEGRFHYEYSDGWGVLAGKSSVQAVQKNGKNGKYSVDVPVAGWSKEEENGLWVKVGAQIRGESEIQWGEPVFLSGVLVRNSPLWVTKPDQQIAYLAVKYWARLYCPAVILGVYTSDELQDNPRQEKEVSGTTIKEMAPKAALEPALDDFEDAPAEEAAPKKEPKGSFAKTDIVLQDIAKASTVAQLESVGAYAGNVVSGDLDMVRKAFGDRQKELKGAGNE